MRVHFIAIGGAAMHNLAIALKLNGFLVSGSDDLIAEPSFSRLKKQGLLPDEIGWDTNNIHNDIDAIILGMHARIDNPELLKAQELGLPIYSYPDYIFKQSENKIRVVIGGSHGKTTITSMILYVLNYYKKDFDYLVGAQIDGFENMVKLSEAPIIIIEGDEYLASPIDRRPKFHIYKPHIAVISGIAWDHINVFPTFENYVHQFGIFIDTIHPKGCLIYCKEDKVLSELVDNKKPLVKLISYELPLFKIVNGLTSITYNSEEFLLNIFGRHNLLNLNAAKIVCLQLGISEIEFFTAILNFTGAAKRLEIIKSVKNAIVFKDFAHSPSKLKATIAAVKEQYPDRKLIACIELHTFSSLDKNFIGEYKNSMNEADEAIVFVEDKVFKQKGLETYSEIDIKKSFANPNLLFFNQSEKLFTYLTSKPLINSNLLMMSSGNFGTINLEQLSGIILE